MLWDVLISPSLGDVLVEGTHTHVPSPRLGRTLRAPLWDLPLVLRSLTQDPCEPVKQSNLKFLSHRAAFLLAIGSGKRVSELLALSVSDECLRLKADKSLIFAESGKPSDSTPSG